MSERVCVFCGSGAGTEEQYRALARELGRALAQRGLGLVYGGASVGLMGELADAALAAGAQVIGVIPEMMVARELAHTKLTELFVVPNMHARKAKMAELANAFVALPGGFGTLDELFEVTTWFQLGIHSRPIGLLDIDGFFQPLLDFAANAADKGFIKPEHRRIWTTSRSPDALLDALLPAQSA